MKGRYLPAKTQDNAAQKNNIDTFACVRNSTLIQFSIYYRSNEIKRMAYQSLDAGIFQDISGATV
jgi:hypothetical protein